MGAGKRFRSLPSSDYESRLIDTNCADEWQPSERARVRLRARWNNASRVSVYPTDTLWKRAGWKKRTWPDTDIPRSICPRTLLRRANSRSTARDQSMIITPANARTRQISSFCQHLSWTKVICPFWENYEIEILCISPRLDKVSSVYLKRHLCGTLFF